MITDSGWLIHKRPQGDTSLYLTLFCSEHGVIRGLYKGGRSLKKKAALQNFVPLWLEWSVQREYCYIRKAELQATPLSLTGTALICAMYANELIYLCLKQPEPSCELYASYEQTLIQLSQRRQIPEISGILRQFEWALLHHCGAGFSLFLDAQNAPIEKERVYHFIPQSGFIPAQQGITGDTIIAIRENRLHKSNVLRTARLIMRGAINELIEYRPLQSRKLLTSFVD